ncbi:hypothetical protein GCM10010321_70860 [Streptomyces chartreusis]|nr:hypothetical protein GCM10010321_70860 [Streptomyces chartreusis]
MAVQRHARAAHGQQFHRHVAQPPRYLARPHTAHTFGNGVRGADPFPLTTMLVSGPHGCLLAPERGLLVPPFDPARLPLAATTKRGAYAP